MSLKDKYDNGNIPSKALTAIDTGQLLQYDAAKAYMRMKVAAAKDGVTINLSGNDSGYRNCGAEGDYTKRKCSDGFTQWCAWEKFKAGHGNLAANPTTSKGCKSNHGWGRAIDVKGSTAQNWIKKNGEQYGWWWSGGTFSKIENWHFDYDSARDQFKSKKKETKTGKDNNLAYAFLGVSVVAIGVLFWYYTRPE
jgi:hypothetical protein